MSSEDLTPPWGTPASKAFGRWLLRLMGWRLDVNFPAEPKLVIAAAPHTSNWDGVVAVISMIALGVRINWFAKDSLFKFPFRGLLIRLGGVPIVRDAARGVVEQTAEIFAEKERMYIVVAPEGTRARAVKWKSGFYRIAMAAKAPILLAYVDYRTKVIGTGPVIRPSGDFAADLETMQAFYRGITPKHAERFAAEG